MKYILCLLFTAAAMLAGDATGTWTGTFTPEGRNPGPAQVVLKQEGTKLTGTIGPDASERHEIQNGKAEDGKLIFEVETGEGVARFVLTQNGDEIRGEASRQHDGKVQTAKLEVKRSQ